MPNAGEAVKDTPITAYIGWDSRESVCSYVAAHTIRKRTDALLNIQYLKHRELRNHGDFARPWLVDGATGNFTDLIDGKPFSTEFSHTRFLVPHLMNYRGWALFMDADMIFLSDIKKLFAFCDDKYAIMCVKHRHNPDGATKMDNRLQTRYHRKNWSSFVLWNCGHEANKKLTPECVNFMPGRNLHAFTWLDDSMIGDLPFTYNYISGVSPHFPKNGKNNMPDVIHYTEGGPWFDENKEVPYAHSWTMEYESWQRAGGDLKVSSVATNLYEMPERTSK